MLGLRFKVLILVPVTGFAWAIVAVDGIARGDSVWQLAIAMVVVATSVQLGYLGGGVLRFVIGTARATSHGRDSMPTSAGMSGSV